MKSLYTAYSTLVTMVGVLVLVALVSPADVAAQTTPGVVKVSTAPQLVRDVDTPGLNPYQKGVLASFTGSMIVEDFDLPANEVVVVDHVSAYGLAITTGGGILQAILQCRTSLDPGGTVNHPLIFLQQGPAAGVAQYVISQPVTCYAASPGILRISILASSTNNTFFNLSISGHTVPK